MPTKKHRYMIVLTDSEIEMLEHLMLVFNTRQRSKVISVLITIYYLMNHK